MLLQNSSEFTIHNYGDIYGQKIVFQSKMKLFDMTTL